MIKECILAKTGIQFDMDYLRDALDFDFDDLLTEVKNKGMEIADLGGAYEEIGHYAQESLEKKEKAKVEGDSDHGFFDQLIRLAWVWWIFEFLSLRSTYQDPRGNWIRLRR